MKKFLLVALTAACTVIMGSCEKSESLSTDGCKLEMNLFTQTYTVDEEGCCVLKGIKPIAADEVQSKVTGYGWKAIGTYEVQDNGKLSTQEYWSVMVGGGPVHYWFESSRQVIQYFYYDAMPAFCFHRGSWSYDADNGFILLGDNESTTASEYMQILKLDKSNGKVLMYTMERRGVTLNGKSIYTMVVYRRMTDEELENTKKSYTYDLDSDRSAPDNCKFKV